MEDNYNMMINENYPVHIMALTKEGINLKIFHTLEEFWGNADEQDKNRKD